MIWVRGPATRFVPPGRAAAGGEPCSVSFRSLPPSWPGWGPRTTDRPGLVNLLGRRCRRQRRSRGRRHRAEARGDVTGAPIDRGSPGLESWLRNHQSMDRRTWNPVRGCSPHRPAPRRMERRTELSSAGRGGTCGQSGCERGPRKEAVGLNLSGRQIQPQSSRSWRAGVITSDGGTPQCLARVSSLCRQSRPAISSLELPILL